MLGNFLSLHLHSPTSFTQKYGNREADLRKADYNAIGTKRAISNPRSLARFSPDVRTEQKLDILLPLFVSLASAVDRSVEFIAGRSFGRRASRKHGS
jgi:hypothetical protein